MKPAKPFIETVSIYLVVFLLITLPAINNELTAQESQNIQGTEKGASFDDSSVNEPLEGEKDAKRPRTLSEWVLSICILLFGLIILGLEVYLIKVNRLTADVTVRLIIVTLIIIGTLFLIAAGYSNNQIAPATGLLGTIAGYILGRMSSNPPAV